MPPPRRRVFDIDAMIAAYEACGNQSEVGRQFGISHKTVGYWLVKRGVPRQAPASVPRERPPVQKPLPVETAYCACCQAPLRTEPEQAAERCTYCLTNPDWRTQIPYRPPNLCVSSLA